jgi:hypothetical protein
MIMPFGEKAAHPSNKPRYLDKAIGNHALGPYLETN